MSSDRKQDAKLSIKSDHHHGQICGEKPLGKKYTKPSLTSLDDIIMSDFFSSVPFGMFFFYNEHMYLSNQEKYFILVANAYGVLSLCQSGSKHLLIITITSWCEHQYCPLLY